MIFTIGHSTRTADEVAALLREAGVDLLVDVRRFPGSRRHPQFNAEAIAATLAENGIGYRHLAALGGRRAAERDPAARHTLWREPGFRNYAGYAESAAFRAGLDELLRLERTHRPAIMCAEAVWWRCHRRIITDYLLVAGREVRHILGPHKIEPARLTEGAAPQPDGTLLYGQPTLL